MRELELYVHIPFCVRKCRYCDFLSAPASFDVRESYVRKLTEQMTALSMRDRKVTSIFIGGGTPSLLEAEQIGQILDALRQNFEIETDAEITIECNPGTLSREKLRYYRSCGISRLSLGLQSADDRELRLLGRIHTFETFLDNFTSAREAGFSNINVDLICGLPGQTAASWRNTLTKVLSCGPEHVSAYDLIIEPGTDFWRRYHEDDVKRARGEKPEYLPDEDTQRAMERDTLRMLQGAGLHRYEISNYAKPGYECRHNLGYWVRREYLGFGLGAASLLSLSDEERLFGTARRNRPDGDDISRSGRKTANEGVAFVTEDGRVVPRMADPAGDMETQVRFRTTPDLGEFLSGDFTPREEQVLSTENQMEETMFLGLRLTRGVDLGAFRNRFGRDAEEVYPGKMRKFCEEGLAEIRDGRFCLNERGLDVSNAVMAEFLLT